MKDKIRSSGSFLKKTILAYVIMCCSVAIIADENTTVLLRKQHVKPFIDLKHEKIPKSIVIKEKVLPKITIDGIMDEKAWAGAALAQQFLLLKKSSDKLSAPSQATEVRVLYDKQNIYLGFKCHEKFIKDLNPKWKNDGEPVWADDCIEFFIDTKHNHKSYYQFAINCAGVKSAWVRKPECEPVALKGKGWYAKASKKKSYWFVEVKIPFKFFGIKRAPANYSCWGINFCRERYVNAKEFSSWSALTSSFHAPSKFAHMYFSKKVPFTIKHLYVKKLYSGENAFNVKIANNIEKGNDKVSLVIISQPSGSKTQKSLSFKGNNNVPFFVKKGDNVLQVYFLNNSKKILWQSYSIKLPERSFLLKVLNKQLNTEDTSLKCVLDINRFIKGNEKANIKLEILNSSDKTVKSYIAKYPGYGSFNFELPVKALKTGQYRIRANISGKDITQDKCKFKVEELW